MRYAVCPYITQTRLVLKGSILNTNRDILQYRTHLAHGSTAKYSLHTSITVTVRLQLLIVKSKTRKWPSQHKLKMQVRVALNNSLHNATNLKALEASPAVTAVN